MNQTSFNNYKKMPWKNGGGITYEVIIHPPKSNLLELNFDFRISMAQISGPNHFSHFKSYDRILTVIRGTGIFFNEEKLLNGNIKLFSGEENVISKPIVDQELILDLGVIYKKDIVEVEMLLVDCESFKKNKKKYEYIFLINSERLDTIQFHQYDDKQNLFDGLYYFIGVNYLSE